MLAERGTGDSKHAHTGMLMGLIACEGQPEFQGAWELHRKECLLVWQGTPNGQRRRRNLHASCFKGTCALCAWAWAGTVTD